MEFRGMLGSLPVVITWIRKDQVAVISSIDGQEVIRAGINQGINLEGDLLEIGGFSIAIDRSYLPEAQNFMNAVLQSYRVPMKNYRGNMRFCTQCGVSVDKAASYCSACGNPLRKSQVQEGLRQDPINLSLGMGGSETLDASRRASIDISKLQRIHGLNSKRILSFMLVSAAVIAISIAVISRRDSSNEQISALGEVSVSSACEVLSQYAYNGIPATFVDEGAGLLRNLSEQFRQIDQAEVADRIDHIVELTYNGSTGQIEAKKELISAADDYC